MRNKPARSAWIAFPSSGLPPKTTIWRKSTTPNCSRSEGKLEKSITDSHAAPNAPISDVRLGAEIEGVVARAAELLGDTEIAALLKNAYRPGETLGSAFAQVFARLFGDSGVVLLDASDPELHQIAQPVYRAAVVGAEEIDNALLARGKELRAAGYHEQVKVTPSSTLLFEKRKGAREVIHRRDGGFIIGNDRVAQDDLLAQIAAEPQRFSANVLLRPVVQDFLLPTIAYTGGPAEVAYFAQAAVVYEEVLGRVTPVLPRFSATLVDARAHRLLAKYRVSLPDLFHGPEAFRELLALRSIPGELDGDFLAAEEAVLASVAEGRGLAGETRLQPGGSRGARRVEDALPVAPAAGTRRQGATAAQ